MKTLVLQVLNAFYKYYDKGPTQYIAYESALLALILVLFMNLFTIEIVIGTSLLDGILFDEKNKWISYLKSTGVIFIFFFVLRRLFKEEEVANYPEERQINGYFVFLYFILSFLFLILIIKTQA
jgi:hypothetical protein